MRAAQEWHRAVTPARARRSGGQTTGSAPFVGRRPELAVVGELVDRLADGQGSVLEVTGEPGIGKTRILTELARLAAERGLPVLAGRAGELERGIPFGVFADALDDHLDERAPALAALGPDQFELLGSVFPAFAGRAGGEAPVPSWGYVERYRRYRAVRALLDHLVAETGLVITLDDLHWADEASLELVDYLLRHPARGPLLLAFAHRSRQTPARLAASVHAAQDDEGVHHLALAPLAASDADRLIPGAAAKERRRLLHRASGGNPLYLSLAAHLPDDVLSTLGAAEDVGFADIGVAAHPVLEAEFAGLGPVETHIAAAAAVAGEEFVPGLVAAVSGIGPDHVTAALDVLVAHDLLRPAGSGFRFRHPLLRAAAYRQAGAAWCRSAHARAHAHLREVAAPVTRCAHHAEMSAEPGDEVAQATLIEAAQVTIAHAPATAAHWLRAALRLVPDTAAEAERRTSLQLLLARALGVAGDLAGSRDILHDTIARIPAADVALRSDAVAFCALVERLRGRLSEARALVEAELASLPPGTAAAIPLQLELAGICLLAGDAQVSVRTATEVLQVAQVPETAAEASARTVLVLAACHQGATGEAVEQVDRAAWLFDAMPDQAMRDHLDAVSRLAWAEIFLERHHDALRHLRRAEEVVRQTGWSYLLPYLLIARCTAYTRSGQLEAALSCVDDIQEIARLIGGAEIEAMALALGVPAVLACRGPEAALAQARTAATASQPGWWSDVAQNLLGQALLTSGDPAGCVRTLLRPDGTDLRTGDVSGRALWYDVLVQAELARGQVDAAERWADRADQTTAGLALAGQRAYADLALARVLAQRGRTAEALERVADATAKATACEWPVVAGQALMLWAGILESQGEADAGVAKLREAKRLLTEAGATWLVARIVDAERRRGAGATRHSRRHGPAAMLSARELEVAELVSAGLTNRQVAERLFLSPRTVDSHVTRLFTKLGVTTRTALAAKMADLKGPPG
jgi:DNA-binding NarL/FixJ family response regulator